MAVQAEQIDKVHCPAANLTELPVDHQGSSVPLLEEEIQWMEVTVTERWGARDRLAQLRHCSEHFVAQASLLATEVSIRGADEHLHVVLTRRFPHGRLIRESRELLWRTYPLRVKACHPINGGAQCAVTETERGAVLHTSNKTVLEQQTEFSDIIACVIRGIAARERRRAVRRQIAIETHLPAVVTADRRECRGGGMWGCNLENKCVWHVALASIFEAQ